MRKAFLIFICLAFLMPVVVMAEDDDKITIVTYEWVPVKDVELMFPAIQKLELTDGNGTATFWYNPFIDHKETTKLLNRIKKLYNENPAYYNGYSWDFRTIK